MRMASAATDVRKVISTHGRPPLNSACANGIAFAASWIVMTGIKPTSPKRARISVRILSVPSCGRLPGTFLRRRHKLGSYWIMYRFVHDLIHGSQRRAIEFPAHYVTEWIKLTRVTGSPQRD